MRRVQRALTAKQNGNTGYMQEGEKDALFQYCLTLYNKDAALQTVPAAYVYLCLVSGFWLISPCGLFYFHGFSFILFI